jgi:hypothetical protein
MAIGAVQVPDDFCWCVVATASYSVISATLERQVVLAQRRARDATNPMWDPNFGEWHPVAGQ